MKSVLHLNYNFTLVPIMVKAQRRLGWKAGSVAFSKDFYGFEDDYYIEAPKWVNFLSLQLRKCLAIPSELKQCLIPKSQEVRMEHSTVQQVTILGWKWRIAHAEQTILRFLSFLTQYSMHYDILHFHYHSALPMGFNYIDLILWRLLGRKVIMQYEGSDIRGQSHILPRLLANSIVVTTPDLLEWEPKAIFIHAPVELTLPYIGTTPHSGPLIIVHAPSNREIKGTAHIVKAVDALKAEGFDLELDIIEKVSYVEAIERYKRADIVIDQVLIGWYGYVAIECMALGKPVMVYIKDDMKQYIPGAPLCFTSTTTLIDDLRGLIGDIKRREELGKAGREYVLKAHDADEVAKRMVKLYE